MRTCALARAAAAAGHAEHTVVVRTHIVEEEVEKCHEAENLCGIRYVLGNLIRNDHAVLFSEHKLLWQSKRRRARFVVVGRRLSFVTSPCVSVRTRVCVGMKEPIACRDTRTYLANDKEDRGNDGKAGRKDSLQIRQRHGERANVDSSSSKKWL
jgi:hypothetical protein